MTARLLHAGHNPDYHHNISLPDFTGVTSYDTRAGTQFHLNWGSTHLHIGRVEAEQLYADLGDKLGH